MKNKSEEIPIRENMTFRALYLIAILFVVDGHIPIEGEIFNFSNLFKYYSFHLMLFAFGSGYFYKKKEKLSISILYLAKKMLIPLYIWNAVYGCIALLLKKGFGSSLGQELSLYTLFIAPITDGQHFIYNLSAWFLSALFFTKIFYRILDEIPFYDNYKEEIQFVICLIIGCIAVEMCYQGKSDFLPLFIKRPMILLPAYSFGIIYKKRLEKIDTLPTFTYLMIIIFLRIILCTKYDNLAYLLSDCTYFPCGSFGVYASAFTAIAFYLRIAKLISPCLEKNKPLLFISRHTFDIMMHHGMGIWITNFIFLIFNKMNLAFKDFSVLSLRTIERYTYAPGGHQEWAVLYLITGIAFSCLIAKIIDIAREKIKFKISSCLR